MRHAVRAGRLGALAVVTVALLACSKSAAPPACTAVAGCAAGKVCSYGQCVPSITRLSDAPCAQNGDCGVSAFCAEGTCLSETVWDGVAAPSAVPPGTAASGDGVPAGGAPVDGWSCPSGALKCMSDSNCPAYGCLCGDSTTLASRACAAPGCCLSGREACAFACAARQGVAAVGPPGTVPRAGETASCAQDADCGSGCSCGAIGVGGGTCNCWPDCATEGAACGQKACCASLNLECKGARCSVKCTQSGIVPQGASQCCSEHALGFGLAGDARFGVLCCEPDGRPVCWPAGTSFNPVVVTDSHPAPPGTGGCCSGKYGVIGSSAKWLVFGCGGGTASVDPEVACGGAASDGGVADGGSDAGPPVRDGGVADGGHRGDCASDADCERSCIDYSACHCRPQTNRCVACTNDSHCLSVDIPKCQPSGTFCNQCLVDSDCSSSGRCHSSGTCQCGTPSGNLEAGDANCPAFAPTCVYDAFVGASCGCHSCALGGSCSGSRACIVVPFKTGTGCCALR